MSPYKLQAPYPLTQPKVAYQKKRFMKQSLNFGAIFGMGGRSSNLF